MKKIITLLCAICCTSLFVVNASDISLRIGIPGNVTFVETGTSVKVVVKVSPTDITDGVLEYADNKHRNLTFVDGVAEETLEDLPIGKCVITASVTKDEETVTAQTSVFIGNHPEERPLPEGMVEGINYNKETKEVTLVFRAPLSRDVYIFGDFNNWEYNDDFHCYRDSVWCQVGKTVGSNKYPDYKDSTYHHLFWRTFKVEEPTKKYGYTFRIDNKYYVDDPYATVVLDPSNDSSVKAAYKKGLPAYPSSKISNAGFISVLELEEAEPYQWEVEDFKIADKKNLVIYELLVRDFSVTRDLSGVLEKMDYLEGLGVNAIELMPVCEFDGNMSWGYNPNHYFAYDKYYGGKYEYKHFIDECHKRGIAVIIDMVFNHATGNCPMAKMYWDGYSTAEENPWFNRVSRHPYTEGGIDINHEYDGTRLYFRRALQYWLTEFKVDGFRMDLAKGFTQRNTGSNVGQWGQYDKTRVSITKDYDDAVKAANPNAIFILEHLGEWQEQKEYSNAGMFPWRNMNYAFGQAAQGRNNENKFVDSDGTGSGTGRGGMFDTGFICYGESHDEERNAYRSKMYGLGSMKNTPSVYLPRMPLNIAFASLLPGPKMMWQFGELGYDYSINTCSDGKTVKDECRVAEKPIPFRLGWLNDALRMDVYEKSSKIIKLRTSHPEFFAVSNVTTTKLASTSWLSPRRLDIKYNDTAHPENSINIIVLGNYDAVNYMTFTGNFSSTGTWYDYLNNEEGFVVKRTDKTITLAPGELKIFTNRKIEEPLVDVDEEDEDAYKVEVTPTVVEDIVSVWSAKPVDTIDVLNMAGAVVRTAVKDDQISLGGLPSGFYVVRVNVAGVITSQKVIKK